MQEKYGFAPLGDANSATKQLIFAGASSDLKRIKAASKQLPHHFKMEWQATAPFDRDLE
jgi:hypothetical protein